jgi:hypothetical protein
MLQDGAYFQEEILPRDREFEALAVEKSTYLWPTAHELSPEQYQEAARCYDVAAKAFDFFDRLLATSREEIDKSLFQRSAQATANAQCGLKSVLKRFNVPLNQDGVQRAAYTLLREYCHSVYLANFQIQSCLNLEQTLAVDDEIDKLAQELNEIKASRKEHRELKRKIEFHLKKIVEAPESLHDWNRIVEATTILCEKFREPASSAWFRERLRDYVDQIPEETETTEVFGRVVQEIDLARLREEEAACSSNEPQETFYSPAVQAVRERFGETQVVFIGGTPQPHLQKRLEKYFNINLHWSEARHSASLDRYAGHLRADETSLFLIYIPWCSHQHSEEFTDLVKKAGKDFVRLRKGTNPEQIAQAICRQCRLLPETEF